METKHVSNIVLPFVYRWAEILMLLKRLFYIIMFFFFSLCQSGSAFCLHKIATASFFISCVFAYRSSTLYSFRNMTEKLCGYFVFICRNFRSSGGIKNCMDSSTTEIPTSFLTYADMVFN